MPLEHSRSQECNCYGKNTHILTLYMVAGVNVGLCQEVSCPYMRESRRWGSSCPKSHPPSQPSSPSCEAAIRSSCRAISLRRMANPGWDSLAQISPPSSEQQLRAV